MLNELLDSYFRLDRLTLIMLMLVLLIGICVIGYSYRYMKGDNFNRIFFIRIGLLMFALMIMISSNNLILLFIAWYSAHALIVRLMIHKPSWQAAKAAGLLIRKYYLASAACIATAFGLFYLSARQLNIQYLIHSHNNSILVLPALMLLVVGVMISSTIWPFHGWLASSLNSPTPVSAIMHAGLVNGGGFLLARFAPLYFLHPRLLTTLFLWGLFSAMLGTIWKLMQTDIKRMLAYSTMGQMGYMLAQCGLGLFSAAIAHLVLHSMFKAYLFLNSANAVKQKNYNPVYSFQLSSLLVALCCGALGSVSFAYANGNMVLAYNTTLVLIIIAFVSSTQLVLTILSTVTLKRVISASLTAIIFGLLYGSSVHLITALITPLYLMQPLNLNSIYILGMGVLILGWLFSLFFLPLYKTKTASGLVLKLYVFLINASQPHPNTLTTQRNNYHYL